METEQGEKTPAELLDRAEKHIEKGDLYSAQNALDMVDKDSARKHYLQSRIYKAKCWYNEQRKQLKKAVKAEPDNEVYKKELDELITFSKTDEYKDTLQRPKRGEMSGSDGFCSDCCCNACGSIGGTDLIGCN